MADSTVQAPPLTLGFEQQRELHDPPKLLLGVVIGAMAGGRHDRRKHHADFVRF